MDRVKALVEKLNTQLDQNEDKALLIITVQQLLTELGGAVSAKPLPQNMYEVPPIEVPELPAETLNEILEYSNEKMEQKEVKDHIVLEPIKDLRSAIGINDKFQFIQELFGGDEKSFEVGIKTINAFKIYPEAQFYIKREFREKNSWDEESRVVKQFDQLVKRRFS